MHFFSLETFILINYIIYAFVKNAKGFKQDWGKAWLSFEEERKTCNKNLVQFHREITWLWGWSLEDNIMKFCYPFLVVFFALAVQTGLAQNTYVPDNNFEQALIDLGYDDVLDDSVLTANISGSRPLISRRVNPLNKNP